MDINTRFGSMGTKLQVLVALTAILAIGGIVVGFPAAMDGETYGYTRIALGALGVAGAALVLFGKDFGKTGLMVILAWAAIQTVYYANVQDGNYTRQLFDAFVGASSSTTINGEVTEYSAVGINLVGLAMLIFAYVCREQSTRWKNYHEMKTAS